MTRATMGLVLAGALGVAAAGCDNKGPTEMIGGPVYDFRMTIDATAANLLPGGTAQVFARGTIVDSARLTLRGLAPLAAGGYTVYAITEPAGTIATAASGVTPDSLGNVVVRIPGSAIGNATTFVVGFGGGDIASGFEPVFFQFRNLTTGAVTATGPLVLGAFADAAATSRRFITPAATRWGWGGLWIDQPADGNIWVRGYVRHVPVTPNGFRWRAWAVRLDADTLRAATDLGLLQDTIGNEITNFETPPQGAVLVDFPKLVFDGTKCELGISLEEYTHIWIVLEPQGASTTRPAPAILYRGAFPRQFVNRPRPDGSTC